jgi:apolipoprotein N-acyltransferase
MPVVRSTPTGISALIDAKGRIVRSIPYQQAGVIDERMPLPSSTLSPFARFGNWLPMLLAAALLICAIVLDGRRRYSGT